MLVQKYLSTESIDESLISTDWTNKMMHLGFILGISERTRVDSKIIESIYMTPRLNPSLRIIAIFRELDYIEQDISNLAETDKERGKVYLEKFNSLSTVIHHIKDKIGCLKEVLCKTYTKVFSQLLKTCHLNHKITLLGLQAYHNKDLINIETSLIFYSVEDLEIIDRYKEIAPVEVLFILSQGSSYILKNKIRPSDPLSILTYNTFFDILKSSSLTEAELRQAEKSLTENHEIYTKNQKFSLSDAYQKACLTQGLTPDDKILNVYGTDKGSYSKEGFMLKKISLEKNKEENKEENKEGTLNECKERLRNHSTEEKNREVTRRFMQLYYSMQDTLSNNGILDPTNISETLSNIKQVSEEDLFLLVMKKSKSEKGTKNKSLLWRIISKAMAISRLFSKDRLSQINQNIDKIVQNANKY